MFFSSLPTPEPIPERVFELCKLVARGKNSKNLFKNCILPKNINGSNSDYFELTLDTAIELKLIAKDEDNLEYVGDKKIIKNYDTFRKYCNSIVWKDKTSHFYKIAKAMMASNDKWLTQKSITNPNIITEINLYNSFNKIDQKQILGARFWISFLGMGFIQERVGQIIYIPNMSIALEDFINISNFEKGKEYSIREFIDNISLICDVFLTEKDNNLNFALSNALRELYDNNKIELKINLDSAEDFLLFHSESHKFTDRITHIVIKGGKVN